MNFRASFCDPFKPEVIEIGDIEKDKIMETFENIPWKKLLDEIKLKNEDEIYYSPSFEIENKENKSALSVTAVDKNEWYIFFKRPKTIKKFLGLIKKTHSDYLTDITDQSESDVKECLTALINNNLEFLERKIS